MSPDEIRAIEWDCTHLINRYATLNDEGRWDELADLYVDDGVMTRPTAPDEPVVGRAAIAAAFRARPPRITRHLCTNVVVTVEGPMAARATSVLLLFAGRQAPDGTTAVLDGAMPLVGGFHDRLVLTDDGWRFTERRGSLTFVGAGRG